MKIIDLLNKIANGEEMPSPIYHNGLYYDFEDGDYFNQENISWLFNDNDINTILNDTVEILEKKIPEKLEILNANEHSKEVYYENYSKEEISLDIETLQSWVNKIIDYLKSKGE